MGVITVLVLAAMVYHMLVGYVVNESIGKQITVSHRKNIFSQVGANVIVHQNSTATVIVDTQLRPLAAATKSKLEGLSKLPVSKVLVTHWHPDHSGGIPIFANTAEVVSHQNVLERLSVPQQGFGLTKPGSHHEFAPRAQEALPNKTFSDKLVVDETASIHAIHYPRAHTDGDIAVFFHNSRVVAVGDLIWPNSFPFVDVHNGGSAQGLELALETIIKQSKPNYRFVPGHGHVMTYDDVLQYHKMVTDTRGWVEHELGEGKSLDQVIDLGLPDAWANWESPLVPMETWIQMIHDSR